MQKKLLFETLFVVTFIAVAILFVLLLSRHDNTDTTPTQNPPLDSVSSATSSSTLETTTQTPPISEHLNTYSNSKLGFSFQYPKEYGNLRLIESQPPYDFATTTHYFKSQFGEFNKMGVYVYTKGYDSGTDTIKQPVCPDLKNVRECEKFVNFLGETYYKVDMWIHADKSTRYEFPLSETQSLIFYDSGLVDAQILDSVTVDGDLEFLNVSNLPYVKIVSIKKEKPLEIVVKYEFLPAHSTAFAVCEINTGCTELVSNFTIQPSGTHIISSNKTLSEGTYYLILIGDSFTDQIVLSNRVEVK